MEGTKKRGISPAQKKKVRSFFSFPFFVCRFFVLLTSLFAKSSHLFLFPRTKMHLFRNKNKTETRQGQGGDSRQQPLSSFSFPFLRKEGTKKEKK